MSTISTNYENAKGALYNAYSATANKLSAVKGGVVENAPKLYSSAKETTLLTLTSAKGIAISTLSSTKETLQNTTKETRIAAAAMLALGIYSYASTGRASSTQVEVLSKQVEALSSKVDFETTHFSKIQFFTAVLPNTASLLFIGGVAEYLLQ